MEFAVISTGRRVCEWVKGGGESLKVRRSQSFSRLW